jgi:hypothetical protein
MRVAAEPECNSAVPQGNGQTMMQGRTERNEIVHMAASGPVTLRAGDLVEVRLVRAHKHSLVGEPTEAAWAAMASARKEEEAESRHGDVSVRAPLPRPAPTRRRSLTVLAGDADSPTAPSGGHS